MYESSRQVLSHQQEIPISIFSSLVACPSSTKVGPRRVGWDPPPRRPAGSVRQTRNNKETRKKERGPPRCQHRGGYGGLSHATPHPLSFHSTLRTQGEWNGMEELHRHSGIVGSSAYGGYRAVRFNSRVKGRPGRKGQDGSRTNHVGPSFGRLPSPSRGTGI